MIFEPSSKVPLKKKSEIFQRTPARHTAAGRPHPACGRVRPRHKRGSIYIGLGIRGSSAPLQLPNGRTREASAVAEPATGETITKGKFCPHPKFALRFLTRFTCQKAGLFATGEILVDYHNPPMFYESISYSFEKSLLSSPLLM